MFTTGVLQFSVPLLSQWMMRFASSFSGEDAERSEATGPSASEEDHFLMARIREGDAAAFEQLFEKWKRPLISFFYRSLGDYHLSEDMALEVAFKVYRSRDRYVPKARFSTWLFQIARNCLIDRSRRKQQQFHQGDAVEGPEWVYPEDSDPIDERQSRIWEDWLAHALEQIPESEKTALLLVSQQGLAPGEAAEIMNITPNHVRVLLHKARNRLRELREETL
jgi:RNA polymerase sigma-70 factor (ECF subfamily)